MCGSFLVFIALIVGLCIRQSEVHQSEASSRLQEPLLGDRPAPTEQQYAMSADLMDLLRRIACGLAHMGRQESLGHADNATLLILLECSNSHRVCTALSSQPLTC